MNRVRRILTAGLLCLGLSACAADSTGAMLGRFLYAQTFGQGGANYTRADAEVVPFATIGLGFGATPREIVLLEKVVGRDHRWMTGNLIVLTTRGGRIVSTGGLSHNLTHTQFRDPDPADGALHRLESPLTVHRIVDFGQERLFGLALTCTFRPRGRDDIEILGETRAALRITERCRCPMVHWTFRNAFWVNPDDGHVLRSRQYLHPLVRPVTMEELRPSTVR